MLSKSKHGLTVPLPCLLILLLLVASFSSHAGLPTVNIPGGGGGGDMMQTIKLLFSGFLVLMGLIICAVGFYMVSGAILATFSEIRSGKAEWGKFVAIVVVGIAILVVIVWLCTEAAKILN
ncbi:TIGR03745 family integrating conjugative element membrane protein [Salmonella enterica subsp. enterica serovar Stanleyville]|nr:TIGR03745 family integrating conjugative element membrane protein [Salmonella enterica subsp. enterica]EDA3137784.1 TIGR03745 family integrating conjugative element membrane protein [Salmonella enterica subsp. enterica serovar Joal]EFU5505924.1 TIGR03745 family integrating conjugative element membrane protein [Salmonella enterica subsp. enterica serovar Stanleyville]EFU8094423.1 TIGR03745 family integrating conjugative element membrane protein [Salmonella enterica subsp. enterica serovar Stan